MEVRTPNQSVSIDNLAATYCISAPAFVRYWAALAGGTFSGPGVSGNNFNPSVAGLGTHIIRYTYDDGNCLTTISRSVTVVPAPLAASFTGLPNAYCVQAAPLTLTGNPAGGVFSGPGISGNTFDPAAAGLGTHTILILIPKTTVQVLPAKISW
ncbi:MAG: hypothetical protein HC912_12910 [Saprospiraceae bacterium]|nr:hypothetical protein [Saprospiraceae bacterium]